MDEIKENVSNQVADSDLFTRTLQTFETWKGHGRVWKILRGEH